MRCAKCGAENTDRAKFCEECGAPFKRRCPSCGAENTPAAKFCLECGKAFDGDGQSRPAPATANSPIKVSIETDDASLDGERKTVTALFADIKGSMELMESLDPEDARAIVDPALKLMIDAVHRFDGYLVQSTGDGIFALFGAPVAHEDHPQRALYAALRIQDEIPRYAAKLREAGHIPIEARVGVNTGEVVVRSIRTGEGHIEYTPIGHSVSLASRMQVLAPVGSIATTEQVRNLCEGYFQFKSLGPTRVKGVHEPVNIFEVTGLGPLRTKLQRAALRGFTRFVGRDAEMAALDRAAEFAKSGHGQIVAVVGEAGVGKSRLFFEFNARHQARWKQLEAFSVSHGKAVSFMPVTELLKNYFGISEGDETRVRREKVAGRIAMLDRALEDTLPYVFGLLGLNEGEDPLTGMYANIRRRRTLDAIVRILIRESVAQPLIVVFEDLHWIDEETQALLNLLAESIGEAAILLALNYRPEYRHDWGTRASFTQIRLEPLKRESADEMLAAMLGNDPSVAPLRKLILDKSDATPFFIEEMVQTLFEEGVLTRNGVVRATRSITEIHLPATVNAVLAARIDRLAADEKELLQTLAVIGDEFALRLVREVVRIPSDDLDSMLTRLQDAEFIYEQPAKDDIEYRFKHALTREVTYNSILMERRRLLHRRAAQAIEVVHRERLEDHYERLAHHYSQTEERTIASHYLYLAGQRAVARFAYHQGLAYFRSALSLLDSVARDSRRDQQELDLLFAMGAAVKAIGGPGDEAYGDYYRRAAALTESSKVAEHGDALRALGDYFFYKGQLDKAREVVTRALDIAVSLDDRRRVADAEEALGVQLYFSGEFTEARIKFEGVLISRKSYPRHTTQAEGANTVASRVFWILGFPDRARALSTEFMRIIEPTGDLFAVGTAMVFGADPYFYCRDLEEVERRVVASERALSTGEMQGPQLIGWTKMLHGWVLAERGQVREGLPLARAGFTLATSTGNRVAIPIFGSLLAGLEAKAGEVEAGLQTVENTARIARETAQHYSDAELCRLKGELLLLRSESIEGAEQSFRTAIEIARRQQAKSWELRATTSLVRLLAKQGKRDEARAMLVDIYNWFTEGFDTADLKDAKALLDELSG